MKKLLFVLIIAFTIASKLFSQHTEVELLFGYQKHDKRFFRSSAPDSEKPETWGTTYLGITVDKNMLQSGKFRLGLGLGYARETNTIKTPYDHCFDRPGGVCNNALAWIDQYSIDMILVPITPKWHLAKNIDVNMSVIPQFYFFKKVQGFGTTSDFKPGLYSIEFNPELEYSIGNVNIGLGFRLFQLKTIDKVYLYGNNFLTANPGYLDRTFDTHNPTKIILSVGYQIGRN